MKNDLISRRAAIRWVKTECNPYGKPTLDYESGKKVIEHLESMPPVQLDHSGDVNGKVDLIDRQAAIDALYHVDEYNRRSVEAIRNLPSAQYEIIRCGQCKYAEVADKEDAQDGYTCQFHRGSIWFSGSYCSWAERRTDG